MFMPTTMSLYYAAKSSAQNIPQNLKSEGMAALEKLGHGKNPDYRKVLKYGGLGNLFICIVEFLIWRSLSHLL